MNFWESVLNELEYQCKTRKWLAQEAKIDVSTIGTGIKRASVPQADVALRISKALNLPLEYLLSNYIQDSKKDQKELNDIKYALEKFKKYKSLISNLEKISEEKYKALENLIEKMVKS